MDKLNTYQIEITETLKRVIPTKANSYEEALKKVREQYYAEKIVLTAEDFYDMNIV